LGQGELDFLSRHRRVGLDTVLFIYHLEGTEPYSQFTTKLFTALSQGRFSALASSLVFTELLVRPFGLGDGQKIRACEVFLKGLPGLEVHPVDERGGQGGCAPSGPLRPSHTRCPSPGHGTGPWGHCLPHERPGIPQGPELWAGNPHSGRNFFRLALKRGADCQLFFYSPFLVVVGFDGGGKARASPPRWPGSS